MIETQLWLHHYWVDYTLRLVTNPFYRQKWPTKGGCKWHLRKSFEFLSRVILWLFSWLYSDGILSVFTASNGYLYHRMKFGSLIFSFIIQHPEFSKLSRSPSFVFYSDWNLSNKKSKMWICVSVKTDCSTVTVMVKGATLTPMSDPL